MFSVKRAWSSLFSDGKSSKHSGDKQPRPKQTKKRKGRKKNKKSTKTTTDLAMQGFNKASLLANRNTDSGDALVRSEKMRVSSIMTGPVDLVAKPLQISRDGRKVRSKTVFTPGSFSHLPSVDDYRQNVQKQPQLLDAFDPMDIEEKEEHDLASKDTKQGGSVPNTAEKTIKSQLENAVKEALEKEMRSNASVSAQKGPDSVGTLPETPLNTKTPVSTFTPGSLFPTTETLSLTEAATPGAMTGSRFFHEQTSKELMLNSRTKEPSCEFLSESNQATINNVVAAYARNKFTETKQKMSKGEHVMLDALMRGMAHLRGKELGYHGDNCDISLFDGMTGNKPVLGDLPHSSKEHKQHSKTSSPGSRDSVNFAPSANRESRPPQHTKDLPPASRIERETGIPNRVLRDFNLCSVLPENIDQLTGELDVDTELRPLAAELSEDVMGSIRAAGAIEDQSRRADVATYNSMVDTLARVLDFTVSTHLSDNTLDASLEDSWKAVIRNIKARATGAGVPSELVKQANKRAHAPPTRKKRGKKRTRAKQELSGEDPFGQEEALQPQPKAELYANLAQKAKQKQRAFNECKDSGLPPSVEHKMLRRLIVGVKFDSFSSPVNPIDESEICMPESGTSLASDRLSELRLAPDPANSDEREKEKRPGGLSSGQLGGNRGTRKKKPFTMTDAIALQIPYFCRVVVKVTFTIRITGENGKATDYNLFPDGAPIYHVAIEEFPIMDGSKLCVTTHDFPPYDVRSREELTAMGTTPRPLYGLFCVNGGSLKRLLHTFLPAKHLTNMQQKNGNGNMCVMTMERFSFYKSPFGKKSITVSGTPNAPRGFVVKFIVVASREGCSDPNDKYSTSALRTTTTAARFNRVRSTPSWWAFRERVAKITRLATRPRTHDSCALAAGSERWLGGSATHAAASAPSASCTNIWCSKVFVRTLRRLCKRSTVRNQLPSTCVFPGR